jgi:hypothetical protein
MLKRITIWSFPFKYLTQNYPMIFYTLIFEFYFEKPNKREVFDLYDGQLVFAIILFILISLLIFGVLVIGLARYSKLDKNSSIRWIAEGLNKAHRKLAIMYYIHFFLQKFILGIMIVLSHHISSLYLLWINTCFQIIFVIFYTYRIYPDFQSRIMALINEILLVVVFAMSTIVTMGASYSNE